MNKRATLLDIAKVANTSFKTVSRVVNGSELVNKETRERILGIIEELNYQPNLVARSLRSNKSFILGVIYIDFDSVLLNKVIKGIESIAEKNKYSVIVTDSKTDKLAQNRNIDTLLNRMVDGIIILPVDDDFTYIEKRIIAAGIPLVVIGYAPKSICNVSTDDELGMEIAIDYLVLKGHKKIAFLNTDQNVILKKILSDSYFSALKKHNISINPELVLSTIPFIEGGYKIARNLFKIKDFSAILCYNDLIAIGVMHYCIENRIKIPEDYSIMGFDDDKNLNPNLFIPLTSIHRYKHELGKEATKLIFKIINKKKIDKKSILLKPFVVERQSVKKIG